MLSTEIPTDVWLYITTFIPDAQLRNMFAVNSIFFHTAMDLRYGKVKVRDWTPKTQEIVARLMDPEVGKRVRSLELRLYRSGYISRSPESKVVGQNSIGKRAMDILRRSRPRQTNDPFSVILKDLEAVFPKVINLTNFSIVAWDLLNLESFLSAAWSSFGDNLRTISIGGNMNCFCSVALSYPSFKSVENLTVGFTDELKQDTLTNTMADQAVLKDHIIPFINKLVPQLKSLEIWSWAPLDLSLLFLNFGEFPVLEKFSIRTYFNKSFSSDPSGLARFLQTSAGNLRELQLRLNCTGTLINPNTELVLSDWLQNTIIEHPFSRLTFLDMYPTGFTPGFDALIASIKSSAHTLERLQVKDRYLKFDEVEAVITAFGPNRGLRTIRLNVWRLTANVFDLLSNKLPNLKDVTLFLGDGVEGDPVSTLVVFRQEIRSRVYNDWKLHNIGIWQGGNKLDDEIMFLVAERIPSLVSFWGDTDLRTLRHGVIGRRSREIISERRE
ncbi:hypothetical protein BD779DRAFT_1433936 [Infundibulicybe gibba]|nr:hypothetical protein BD779DRAFT_1433936 [Infundibulicybe gibba]